MALGNNRDYKTTNDRAKRNLKAHAILMRSYQIAGMNKEEASQCAMKELNTLSTAKIKRIVETGSVL